MAHQPYPVVALALILLLLLSSSLTQPTNSPSPTTTTTTASSPQTDVEEFGEVLVQSGDVEAIVSSLVNGTSSHIRSTALSELKSLADVDTHDTASALASYYLGEHFTGLLLPPTTTPSSVPPLNLTTAYHYFSQSLSVPHPHLARSHYMISFLLQYHPRVAVPFHSELETASSASLLKRVRKEASTPPASPSFAEPSPESESESVTETEGESEGVSTTPVPAPVGPLPPAWYVTEEKLAAVTTPLALLHLDVAVKLGSLDALASLAHKEFRGVAVRKSCLSAAQKFQSLAWDHIEPIVDAITLPIQLGTDFVYLDREYNSGKSMRDEVHDLIQYYRYASDRGYLPESQAVLGLLYYEGWGGLPRDYVKAFHYFRSAARVEFAPTKVIIWPEIRGDAESLAYLGMMHLEGQGVPANNATAVELLHMAEDWGSSLATTQLGICYSKGACGFQKSLKTARELFTEATSKDDSLGMYLLAQLDYRPGTHRNGVPRQVKSLFKRAHARGHLPSTFELGVIALKEPTGCEVASSYFLRVLKQTLWKENAQEAYNYYSERLYSHALLRYELAGDQGHVLSQNNAAWLYDKAFVDEIDFSYPTVNLYPLSLPLPVGSSGSDDIHDASASDSSSSSPSTSSSIDTDGNPSTDSRPSPPALVGEVVPVVPMNSQRKAVQWYLRAAAQDSGLANRMLGDHYYHGHGIAADLKVAAKFYQAAVTLGDAQSSFNIGFMHFRGVGLPKDNHLAKRYYDKSIQLDPTQATIPSQMALYLLEAENLALSWVGSPEESIKFVESLPTDVLIVVVLSFLLLLTFLLRVTCF